MNEQYNQDILQKLSDVEAMLYYHNEKDTNEKIQEVAQMLKEAVDKFHKATGATL